MLLLGYAWSNSFGYSGCSSKRYSEAEKNKIRFLEFQRFNDRYAVLEIPGSLFDKFTHCSIDFNKMGARCI